MAETAKIVFSFKEVAEALVKQQGLREGIWGLAVKFGIQATNMGASDSELKPTAIIPIVELGLERFDKENSLSVDAAKVNSKAKRI